MMGIVDRIGFWFLIPGSWFLILFSRSMQYNDTRMPDPITHPITEEEVAAALAAVQIYLAQEQSPAMVVPSRSAWREAAMTESQGLFFARGGTQPTWGTTERAHRSRRWSKGIVGS